MVYVICIEIGPTLDAKVATSHEAREGIASLIVFSHFNEVDLFVLGRSFENYLVVVIQREYDDLVVDEMTLKDGKFGYTTWSFTDSGNAMQFFSLFPWMGKPCCKLL